MLDSTSRPWTLALALQPASSLQRLAAVAVADNAVFQMP
jgi:hypothetical protein